MTAQEYGRWLDRHLPWWVNGLLMPLHLVVMLVLAAIHQFKSPDKRGGIHDH